MINIITILLLFIIITIIFIFITIIIIIITIIIIIIMIIIIIIKFIIIIIILGRCACVCGCVCLDIVMGHFTLPQSLLEVLQITGSWLNLWMASQLKVLYDLLCSYLVCSAQQGDLYATTLLRYLVDSP